MIKYSGYLLVTANMVAAKKFYSETLEQKIKVDGEVYVVFEGEFSLFTQSAWFNALGSEERFPIHARANNGELYFECEDIQAAQERVRQAGVEFIHETQEQPWGQRVIRFYDPDGTVVEIGETMQIVVLRFYKEGLSIQTISDKTSMPVEFIENAIQESG
jgi:catechol 2,3-dioxygenase-like lactoylglutathione lyase family enzyme